MRIAVTYQDGQVFQHFGHTKQFKIYTVEDGKVTASAVMDTMGQGHGSLGSFLAGLDIDVLICGGIGGGAKKALAEQGIEFIFGIRGEVDAQVAAYLSGELQSDPSGTCNHHGDDHVCHD